MLYLPQLPLFLEMVSISHFMPSSKPTQPVNFLQLLTFFRQGRASLNVPLSVGHVRQLEVLHDLACLECQLQILFVGVHEERHLLQSLLCDE